MHGRIIAGAFVLVPFFERLAHGSFLAQGLETQVRHNGFLEIRCKRTKDGVLAIRDLCRWPGHAKRGSKSRPIVESLMIVPTLAPMIALMLALILVLMIVR